MNDAKMIDGMKSRIAKQSLYLDGMTTLTLAEIKTRVRSVKGMYVQFSTILGRNPDCIPKGLRTRMDTLIRAVSRHEAKLLEIVRMQETGGDRIDLEVIMCRNANVNKLGNTFVMDIVKEEITKDNSTVVGKPKDKFYITATGKKYHVKECPYCNGRNLTLASKNMIKNQKLIPCACIERKKAADELERTSITAFIDESIHPIKWNENGSKGMAGSYSYIVARGNLESEEELTDERVIAKGVDGLNEINHIEKLSEAAIGKVMFSMLYDFGFTGHLCIFTDNRAAMEKWAMDGKNSKLAANFESVTVSFIPREKNTKADKLGRTRMIINVPTEEYSKIVNKCNDYDRLMEENVKVERDKCVAIEEKLNAERIIRKQEEQLEEYRRKAEKRNFIQNGVAEIREHSRNVRNMLHNLPSPEMVLKRTKMIREGERRRKSGNVRASRIHRKCSCRIVPPKHSIVQKNIEK
jgi:hypothetical protein